MTPRVAETVVFVSEEFAEDCYRLNYGCAQLIACHKVLRVVPFDGTQIPSLYLNKRQEDTNDFLERFIRG